MSIVTRLLDMMGSVLHVESEYGKGSEFSFELLQEIVNDEPIGDFEERLKKSTDKNEVEKYLFACGAKILVVDDNDINRKVARSLMKRNGILPDEASSGQQAIEMIAAKRYDIVFLDHMMPKMDGIETLKKLKEKGLIKEDCVIIALTANAVSGAKERYLEAGFDDYLSKPIDVVQLEKKLSTWLPEDKVEWKNVDVRNGNDESRKENSGKIIEAAFGKDSYEFLEFAPGGEADEVIEFTPGGEEDEVIEFTPGGEADEVIEFAPGGEEDEVIELASGEKPDEWIKSILNAGLDTDAALGFCGGDADFYRELLFDYTKACPEKSKELDALLSGIMKEETGQIAIYRDPLDGFFRHEHSYDLVVVALEGAKGMNEVVTHSEYYPDASIIWITSDKDFAMTAIRYHIYDFILRPVERERFRKSIRRILLNDIYRTQSVF